MIQLKRFGTCHWNGCDEGEVANEKVSRLWNERGKAQLPPPHSATNQKTREHNEMDTREKIYRATNVRMPSTEGFFALKQRRNNGIRCCYRVVLRLRSNDDFQPTQSPLNT